MSKRDKPTLFRIARLDGDRFLVEHPNGEIIEVRGEIAYPFLRITKRDGIVALPLPEPMAHRETEHDLGWLWDHPEWAQTQSDRPEIIRVLRSPYRQINRNIILD